MKITIQNLINEYPKINQKILPKELQTEEFKFIKENYDLYGDTEAKEINEYFDLFVEKLNKVLEKSEYKETKSETKKQNKVIKPKTKKDIEHTKSTSKKSTSKEQKVTSKKAKKNEPKAKKTKIEKEKVNKIELQYRILRSFYVMLDKDVPRRRILGLYKRIEKAAYEKELRKTDKFAQQIEYISQILATEYNKKTEYCRIELDENQKAKLKQVAYENETYKSVNLLKRFVNMIGKDDEQKKKSLVSTIEKVKIDSKDPYYKEINSILEVLKSGKSISAVKTELRGILTGLSKKKSTQTLKGIEDEKNQESEGKIVNSNELKKLSFTTIPFSDEWKEIIGEPSNPFYLMIYGLPGSGKSTLTLKFAKYLTQNLNLKVLFWAKEEGISHTLKEKLKRFDAFNEKLFITENFPENLKNFDVLIIDSVNDAKLSTAQIKELQKNNPDLSMVMIFQSTKDGNFKGENEWEHLVQTVIEVKQGVAQTGKNRFGAKSELQIF